MAPDATWRHEKRWIFIKSGYHTIAIGPSTHLKFHRTAQTIRGRTPRSRSDRTAIAHHSSWNHLHDHRTTVVGASIPQSTHDRSAIVVLFQVKLKLTHHQTGAELKPRPMPKESLPRPLQIAPTTASIGHDLLAKFPFKNRCISLLFFNF